MLIKSIKPSDSKEHQVTDEKIYLDLIIERTKDLKETLKNDDTLRTVPVWIVRGTPKN